MVKRILIAGVCLALASPSFAQEGPQEKKLVFVFKDASLEAVLLYVSQVTGWIFVQEAPSRGTITAYSNAEIPVSSCLEFLNVCLRPQGLTVRGPSWPRAPIPGETLRVLDLVKSAPSLPGVHVGLEAREIPVTDEPRTQILPLKTLSAAEAVKDFGDILRKAVGEGGQVAVSSFSNSILLTGKSEGIHRAAEILAILDRTATAQLRIAVLPIEYADALETAKTLNEVFKRDAAKPEAGGAAALPGFLRMMRSGAEGDRSAAPRSLAHEAVRITAEPRTNCIIVGATEENLDLVKSLLGWLDRPSAALNTYVVRLKGLDAGATAAMLNALWHAETRTAPSNAPRSDGTLNPGQVPNRGNPSPATPRSPAASGPRR